MRFRFVASALAVAFLGSNVAAADMMSSSSGSPFAKDYFNGTWSCKVVTSADKSMIGKVMKSTVVPVGKHWQKFTFPNGQLWITWDAKMKTYAGEYIGDDGSWGLGETPGWSGNSLVVKDVVNGGGAPLGVTTITKKSPTAYTSSYVSKGKTLETGSCTKLS